jgi:membrane-associated phospholipid phosphatase
LREFPSELLRNFQALGSTSTLAPLIVGGIAASSATPMDGPIDRYFQLRNRPFARAGNIGGNGLVAGGAIGGLFLLGQHSDNDKFRSFTYSAAQGFIVNHTITSGLKMMTHRLRPDGRNSQSFPSGHTSTAFMWATVAANHYGWKVGLPAYLAASYVGASRLSHKSHHLTDVVAGAAIGYVVGSTVSKRYGFGYDPGRRLNWNVGAIPGGFGAGIEINLGRLAH